MNAKRFMVDDAGTLIDIHTRDTFDYVSDVCSLLNEQHETIERLQKNITELLSVNIEEELLKENEQLKSELQDKQLGINLFNAENTSLMEENEQLKSSDTITDLETEIMKLKTTIQQLRTDNTKQKKKLNTTMKENEQLKLLIKKVLETTPIEHSLALDLKNSIRELYK